MFLVGFIGLFHCKASVFLIGLFILIENLLDHGPPDRLQIDNGSELKKSVIKVNKYKLDITLIFGKCSLRVIFAKSFPHKIFSI